MTVETTARKQSFAGAQTSLTFTFKTIPSHPEHIKVKTKLISTGAETELTYTTQYVVTLATDGVGGTVHVIPSFSSAYTYTVYRDTTKTQESDYDDYNKFPANTLEKDLDRLMCLTQEIREDVDRSVKHPISSTASTELPVPVDGQILQWSGTGGTMVNVAYDTASLNAAITAATLQVALATTQSTLSGNYATSSSTSAISAATSSTLSGNYAISSSTSAIAAATSATLAASLVPSKATGAEAVAGTEDSHYMTPSTSALAIASYISTESTLVATRATVTVSEGAIYSFVTTSVNNLVTVIPYNNGTTFIEASTDAEETTDSTDYVKMKEFSPLIRSGNVTLTWEHKTNDGARTVYSKVYINGVAYGTEKSYTGLTYQTNTEANIPVAVDDVLQVYVKCNIPTAYIQNCRLKCLNPTVPQGS